MIKLYIVIVISLAFIMCPSLINAQNNTQLKNDTIFYIPKPTFKLLYKTTDSIGFKIRGNDTLIRVSKYIKQAPIPGVSVAYELKDSLFLEYYKKIAFQKYNSDDSLDTKTMKYWKDPIKVFFARSVDNKISKKVMSLLKTLNKDIDSLSITKVKRLEDSNFVIYSNEDYQYESKMNTKKVADYFLSWNANSQIYQGAIRINKDKLTSTKIQILKIQELFIGSLGWFVYNDDLNCDSFFANCYSDNKALTSLDLELLKYHYSYGICKGTTRNVFAQQHKDSKELIKKHGEFTKIFFTHN